MSESVVSLYSDVRSEPVKWLWYPYIAMGKITLLQGDPGDGKSTMMMHLIAELTKGGSAPDGTQFGSPRRVIYQCSEDGIADTIKPRLLASGADCAMTAFLNEEKLGNITLDDERLRQAIIEFRPALLVVDPIQAYIGNCSDLQMAGKARKLTQRLGMWASMYDCAIVLIGHMNKREGQKNLYRGLGSIDLAASARSVLQVERVPEDENIRIVQQIKNNLGPKGNDVMFSITTEAGFQWQACEATPRPYMETQENLVFDTKMDKAAYFLKLYLQNEDMRSREVLYRLKNEGISKRTAELVKESLGIRSYRKMREWFWTMRTKDEMEGKGS